MANEKEPQVNEKYLSELEKNVQDSIDQLYTDIRGNTPEVSRTIDYLRSRMHRAIDGIINYNTNSIGISNISSLYARLNNVQSDGQTVKALINTFENDSIMNNVMSLYSQNVYLKEADKEFEVIMKYMPKLYDALDTRKEAVLSADHFTKDSINIKSSSADLSEVSVDNNIKEMREKYEIDTLIDRIYDETDKLGECYIYCVPYKKALDRLMDKKNRNSPNSQDEIHESYLASYNEASGVVDFRLNPTERYIKETPGLQIEINRSGIIDGVIQEHYDMENVLNEVSSMSLNEAEMSKAKMVTTVSDDEVQKSMYQVDKASQDGFFNLNNKEKASTNPIKVPGCVVKILDHTMVKPLYIVDDMCAGYYYIETDKPLGVEQLTFSSTLGGLKPGNTARKIAENRDDNDSAIIKKIAKQLSEKIDSKFVNANQDLTKEIYAILKYNMTHNGVGRISKVKVTFIPPEDMIHSYFNKDPKSNRGISSLQRALFPAKLYSCLYISNVIAILTRGNDKRVYYVKQNADTNISAVLLNTINQIKQSNFGLRQIENMNNIMNITGRFNDYVIPESANGDAPVRFEVMQGQEVQHPTELMNQLEEMAINATDVPMEIIQARQQLDYATHYTMSNTRFLRKVYNLQAKFTKIINKLLTRIYDAEFECNDSVLVELPPPMYLALTNSSQMFQSANEHVENVAPMYIDVDNEDPVLVAKVKAKIKKFYMRSFLPDEALEQIVEQTRMEFVRDKKESDPNMGGEAPM